MRRFLLFFALAPLWGCCHCIPEPATRREPAPLQFWTRPSLDPNPIYPVRTFGERGRTAPS